MSKAKYDALIAAFSRGGKKGGKKKGKAKRRGDSAYYAALVRKRWEKAK